MPKQRITKEMVVDAAFEIARNDGMEQQEYGGTAAGCGYAGEKLYWQIHCGAL